MKLTFPKGHRSRLNADKEVPAGTYDASELPKDYVAYVLEQGIAYRVTTAGASESRITTVGDNVEREALLIRYEAIYGKAAPGNISDDTLRDRVENPPTDDTQHADD